MSEHDKAYIEKFQPKGEGKMNRDFLWTVFFSGREIVTPLGLFDVEDEAMEYAAMYSLNTRDKKQFAYVIQGNFFGIDWIYL